MRVLIYIVATLAVMGLGNWAYVENYKTQAALEKVDRLHGEIGQIREELGVLRAEWAYLNRPDRLRDLAEINFDRLGLLPLMPEQFGSASAVAYPLSPGARMLLEDIDLGEAIDVSAGVSE